jgi:DNA-binding transcriptional MerR regulator
MSLWLIMLDRMTQKDLTLQDLAKRSDVEARTIRSWIQQGLVPGPRALGRKARYGPDSLTHLLAVKAMRDLYGMPLQAIRQELLVADRAKLETYARQLSAGVGEDETGAAGPGTGAADAVPEAPPATTAAEYLRALRASGRFGRAGIELSRRAAGAPSDDRSACRRARAWPFCWSGWRASWASGRWPVRPRVTSGCTSRSPRTCSSPCGVT